MDTTTSISVAQSRAETDSIKEYLEDVSDNLLTSLPPAGDLSASERRALSTDLVSLDAVYAGAARRTASVAMMVI
jgi:hypothetical protein